MSIYKLIRYIFDNNPISVVGGCCLGSEEDHVPWEIVSSCFPA